MPNGNAIKPFCLSESFFWKGKKKNVENVWGGTTIALIIPLKLLSIVLLYNNKNNKKNYIYDSNKATRTSKAKKRPKCDKNIKYADCRCLLIANGNSLLIFTKHIFLFVAAWRTPTFVSNDGHMNYLRLDCFITLLFIFIFDNFSRHAIQLSKFGCKTNCRTKKGLDDEDEDPRTN